MTDRPRTLRQQIEADAAALAALPPAERRLVARQWAGVQAELRRVNDECAAARWSSQ